MKKSGIWFAIMLALLPLMWGCSTTQVAQLDTTLKPTKAIDFYKNKSELLGKPYREVAYLTSETLVNEFNYTQELGKLMDQARRIGADALVLDPGMDIPAPNTVFRATAIVYNKSE